jgi:hypothetical protein
MKSYLLYSLTIRFKRIVGKNVSLNKKQKFHYTFNVEEPELNFHGLLKALFQNYKWLKKRHRILQLGYDVPPI